MDKNVLLRLMVDLHRSGQRQGPGSEQETLRALELTRLDRQAPLEVADIGCGTGASTLALATRLTNARIKAVDLFPELLEVLATRARESGVTDKIETLACSMESLPFQEESFDLIWSEGAVYNIGFKNGITAWRPFLRPGGVLALSEITWLRPDPPKEILEHWESEYAEIATAPEKIAALQTAGYDLLGYFTLPSVCWIENYYDRTVSRIADFLDRHGDQPEAHQIVAMERQESDLYRLYQDWFSYGFYIARKR